LWSSQANMILFLLEDDADDQTLFKEALSEVDSSIILTIASNGREGLEHLNRSLLKPDIIFADINMPLMNGIEFLYAMKRTPYLQDIPAILLSTTRPEEHIHEINDLGVPFYSKPAGFKELCLVISNGIDLVRKQS
jgi:CheY-like chemotaxis protein